MTGVVEQLRGDIYAARVSFAGAVLDPDGIQMTTGPLPEDLPPTVAANGRTVFAFSKLNGAVSPEIQRIGYRVLENAASSAVTITLTPINPPIQIPASGGSFSFDATLSNQETTPQTCDVWIMVTLPNGSLYGPVLGPVSY